MSDDARPGRPVIPDALPRRAAPSQLWATIRHRQLSPEAFRRIAAFSVWILGFIIVSGGLVRLTGSGLGCKDWPTCSDHRVVAPWQFHAWVEFGNRLITGVVSVAVVVAVLGALVRVRRRRDLTWLSLGLIGGVIAEIILGGITVEHKLAPQYVSAHFLLAVVFLADAVVLWHRAGIADVPVPGRPGRAVAAGPAVRLVTGWPRALSLLLVPLAGVVVVLGTVVTSTGPHAGAPSVPRYHFSLHAVAQLHGTSVEVFLAVTLLTLWGLSRQQVDPDVTRRAELLLVALVAQGAVGYTQYFTGVPAALVAVHELGSALVVVAVLCYVLGLTARPSATPPRPAPAAGPAATGAVPARVAR